MAEAKEPKEAKKFAHQVLRPLRNDGKHYPKGSTVQLTAEEAVPLLKTKVVTKLKCEEPAN